MNIDYIKRKRQKSVQDQNAVSKHSILTCANSWIKGEKLPAPIETFLCEKGFNRQNSLLVEYHDGPAQIQMSYSGLLLTNEEVFIGFEFDLNARETSIEHIEQFGPVEIDCSSRVKGTGKSFGCLCKEVFHELRS